MSVEKWLNRTITFSFYALFFFVPLAIWGDTSELFEFNKMWLTFGLTIIIVGSWIGKMLLHKRFFVQRAPLDIPVLLFLLSQVISTFHSIDPHISLWGYYSRFNGGLLSTIAYILLYYAFVSNFLGEGKDAVKTVKRMLLVSLASAAVVALWGLPSHFGKDPTCLLFRGSLDVSCWTADFQPKIRIFSTLGQPDWLAAYLAILLPVSLAFFLKKIKLSEIKKFTLDKKTVFAFCFLLLSAIAYVDVLFTGSKSGVLATIIAIAVFLASLFFFFRTELKPKLSYWIIGLLVVFGMLTFLVGTPFSQLDKVTLPGLQKTAVKTGSKQAAPQAAPAGELGGTDSGKIRLYVWQGALDIWKANPLFGTGVETFAFAYYQHRPLGHNMTSEWNFLYNKAHNEYLNYLATTGIFGLGTYLLMIAAFLYLAIKKLLNPHTPSAISHMLPLALLAGYLSILITNFFGFSVVIVNIYLFLIPAFAFILLNMIEPNKEFSFPKSNHPQSAISNPTMGQWITLTAVGLIAAFMLLSLLRFWIADRAFGYGNNLDRAGDYQQGYQPLHDAVANRGDEPVFKDEMSVNDAVLATAFLQTKSPDATAAAQTASQLAGEAITTSNQLVSEYPNNLLFLKSRFRIFYTLAQVDPKYYQQALEAMQKASVLAPTDPTISYYLGVLYGQVGENDKAVATLERTIQLKPDYRDPHYALGLFYHQLSVGKTGAGTKIAPATNSAELEQKAVDQMHYILQNLGADDKQVLQTLQAWGEK